MKNYPVFMKTLYHNATAFLTLLTLTGCNTMPTKLSEFDRSQIMVVNGRGRLLDPVGTVGRNYYSSLRPMKETIAVEKEEEYVGNVAKNIGDRLAAGQDVVIYIHGGLNTQVAAMQRADRLFMLGESSNGEKNPHFVAINWQSSWYSSYRDNLFFLREGRDYRDSGAVTAWGVITSPTVLIRDVGGMFASAPYVWERSFSTYWSGALENHNRDILSRRIQQEYMSWHQHEVDPETFDMIRNAALPLGKTRDIGSNLTVVSAPFRMITGPFVKSFGTPCWDVMRRRTTLPFHRPPNELGAGEIWTTGVLTKFGDSLVQALGASENEPHAELPELNSERQRGRLVLVCHSMGAMIGSKLLQMYPDVRFDDIVFMGAANTVQNLGEIVIPYLARESNQTTNFYNLVLHPKNELRESNFATFAPKGSLLVYIDQLLVHPDNLLERTAGRYENFVMAIPYLQEMADRVVAEMSGVQNEEQANEMRNRILGQIYLHTFPYAKDKKQFYPREHGDFSGFNFWQSGFYDPRQQYSGVRDPFNFTPVP